MFSILKRVVGPWLPILIIGIVLTGCQSAEEKAQSHYENGLKLVEQKDLVKAKLEFRNAIKLNKNLTPALYSLGKIEFAQKNYSAAVKMLLAVAAADPKHIDARVDVARIYLLAGQRDQALKSVDEAYALDPKNLPVLALKGAIAIQQKSLNKALGFANAALEIDPEYIDALVLLAAERMASSDPKAALVHIEKSLALDENNLGVLLFKMRVLEQLKDKDGIENVLIIISAASPKNLEMHNNLARWYLREKKTDEAEKVLREFQKNNPDNQQAGFNLVSFLKIQRSDKAARKELKSLIETSEKGVFNYKLAFAELVFSSGDIKEGTDFVTKLIDEADETEDSMKARMFLAQQLLRLNKQDEALALAETVLASDSNNVNALLIRATINTFKNDYTAATDDLRTALSEEPRSAGILRALANIYERSGKIELAEENLAKAVAIQEFKPGLGLDLAQFLLRYGKAKNAETVLQNVLEKTPANEPALKQLARIRLSRGDWQGATEIAASLSKINDKNDALVDRIRARVLVGQNQIDKSIELLQQSLVSRPDDQSPLRDLFRLYVRTKNFDAAEELVKTTLRSGGDKVLAHIRLASLSRLRNQMDQAEASLKMAMKDGASDIRGYYAISQLYFSTGRNEDAEKFIRQGLEIQKNHPTMQLLLANVLERTNKIDEAIEVYEAMYKAEPRSLVVANNLASMLSEYKDSPDNLKRAYEIAYSRFRSSKTPQFLDTLGWIYVLRGDYGEGVALLRKAAEGLPKFGVIHYHLGMAYKGLDRPDQALASLKTADSLMQGKEFHGKELLQKSLQELLEKANSTKD